MVDKVVPVMLRIMMAETNRRNQSLFFFFFWKSMAWLKELKIT